MSTLPSRCGNRARASFIVVLALAGTLCAACGDQPSSDSASLTATDAGTAAFAAAELGQEIASASNASLLSVTLPPSVSPQDMTISASHSVEIDHDAQIKESQSGYGRVGAFGDDKLEIEHSADVGNVYSLGRVEVESRGHVHGSVTSGSTVSVDRFGKVDGAILERQAIQPDKLERLVTFPIGNAGAVFVGSHHNRTLAAGAYGRVEVFGRLTLKTGTYYLESLDVSGRGILELDQSAGPIYVFISSKLESYGAVVEKGGLPGDALFGYFGRRSATIDAPFVGTVVAPNATLELTPTHRADHRGAFFAKRVDVEPGVSIVHVPFPSWVVQDVKVSNSKPCPNEPVLVEVVARSATGAPDPTLKVVIDGIDGASRYLQFPNPGKRSVRVSVFDGRLAFGRTIDIDVQRCTQVLPRVAVTSSIFKPYGVEFQVTNAAKLTGPNRRFIWNYGDGTTEESDVPFRSHSYAGSVNATDANLKFTATLRITRDGVPDVVATKIVSMINDYVRTKSAGFVRPPVTYNSALRHIGKHFSGPYSVRNLETTPVHFVARRLERHFCDPNRNPESLPIETIDLTVPGGGLLEQDVALVAAQFGSDTCGVSVHLGGTTTSGLAVRASAHFETPATSSMARPLTNTQVRDQLNDLARRGLVPNPNRITDEDLERLVNEGRLSALPRREAMGPVALEAPGSAVGDKCDPEETPPEAGISCQATDEFFVAPPFVRNALKGDLIIVSACGTVGDLLRAVLPRQNYSHEGIFTRNYYELSHSTANEDRIIDSVSGPFSIIDENRLKYAWPGSLHESVDTAFNGLPILDPEGALRVIRGFHANASQCNGDARPNPPIVIRPPLASSQEVRDLLHLAADFAHNQSSHYRFFGFSEANIAFDPPNTFSDRLYRDPSGKPATVSTSFLWQALKSTSGLTLEGPGLEPGDGENGATVPKGRGIIDGLYTYTETERREAAEQIYNATKNGVDDAFEQKAGPPWSHIISSPAEQIARQFTNCFAFDKCGRDGVYVDPNDSNPLFNFQFREPGEGVAVSPDDFRFWDSPLTGGVYGDTELVQYRSGDYRRVYRWAPSSGTGTVVGLVLMPDGSPAQDTGVTVAGKSGGTDGNGNFQFVGVPAGSYEVHAQKTVNNRPLVAVANASVDAGTTTPLVILRLGDEIVVPPPTIEVFSRKVKFSGTMYIEDDENGAHNPHTDPPAPVNGECEVSPLKRQNSVTIGGVNQYCVGGEVRIELTINCRLDPDNVAVQVTSEARLYEFNGCDNTELDGTSHFPIFKLDACDPAGCTPTPFKLHVHNDDEGGDFADINLGFTNEQGTKIDLPTVKPENLRRVTVNGDVRITDNDWPDDDENKSVVFGQECIVDPFDREDSVHWSECVDEVRVEVDLSCHLGSDNTSVDVSFETKLFEGTGCANTDLDGTQKREFLAPMCGLSCAPIPLDLTVGNDAERGDDKAVFHLQVMNIQR